MHIDKNKMIGGGIVGVVVLVGMFYGGMAYGKSKIPVRGQGNFTGQFGQMNSTATGARGARGGMGFGGFANGEIIAKDDKSITISVMGGGSKIILLSGTTKVAKSAEGSLSDLVIGTQVSVTGSANTDGSVSAQSVQIRPNMPTTTTGGTMVK